MSTSNQYGIDLGAIMAQSEAIKNSQKTRDDLTKSQELMLKGDDASLSAAAAYNPVGVASAIKVGDALAERRNAPAVKALAERAIGGDQEAWQQLQAINPKMALELGKIKLGEIEQGTKQKQGRAYDASAAASWGSAASAQAMAEQRRQQTGHQSDTREAARVAAAADYVLGGGSPEDQAARYTEARKIYPELPEEYNPALVEMYAKEAKNLLNPRGTTKAAGGDGGIGIGGQNVIRSVTDSLYQGKLLPSDRQDEPARVMTRAMEIARSGVPELEAVTQAYREITQAYREITQGSNEGKSDAESKGKPSDNDPLGYFD